MSADRPKRTVTRALPPAEHRCTAIKARDGKPCGNKARYVYQVVVGHREYFCGIHGRHIVSRNLRELTP